MHKRREAMEILKFFEMEVYEHTIIGTKAVNKFFILTQTDDGDIHCFVHPLSDSEIARLRYLIEFTNKN